MTEDTHYYYSVCAMGPYACSAVVIIQGGTALIAPTSLSAQAVLWNRVDITWTDNTTKETGYELQRSFNGTDGWSTIATCTTGAGAGTGVRTCQDTSGAQGTLYYRVRAVDLPSASAWLSGASASSIAAPYAVYTPIIAR